MNRHDCLPVLQPLLHSIMISIGSTILLVLALLALASFENLWPMLVACIAAVLFLLIGYPLWILVHTQLSKWKERRKERRKERKMIEKR